MNLPNQLTVARCFMAVIFVLLMSVQSVATYFAAYLVFIVAAITDYYDGKIARERNLITNFGKLFDPVADKVLMNSVFIILMTIDDLMIPGWAVVVILAREFLVTGARSLAATEGIVISADKYGKTKTVLQMVYVFTFLFFALAIEVLVAFPAVASWVPGGTGPYIHGIGLASRTAIILVAIYTVYTGVQFARVNWNVLQLNSAS